MFFRRTDNVSDGEKKRLIELFDACLQTERKEVSVAQRDLDFQTELGKLDIDEKSRRFLTRLFKKATVGHLSERDSLQFVLALQKVATKDLTNEEYSSIKRLEFMFAVAIVAGEADRADREAAETRRIEERKHTLAMLERIESKSVSVEFEAFRLLRECPEMSEFLEIRGLAEKIERLAYKKRTEMDAEEKEDTLKRRRFMLERIVSESESTEFDAFHLSRKYPEVPEFLEIRGLVEEIKRLAFTKRTIWEDSENSTVVNTLVCSLTSFDWDQEAPYVPFTDFKEMVLRDILGNKRPRNIAAFRRILRRRGILSRHSS